MCLYKAFVLTEPKVVIPWVVPLPREVRMEQQVTTRWTRILGGATDG